MQVLGGAVDAAKLRYAQKILEMVRVHQPFQGYPDRG
jgi:hypothetical protein